MLKNVQIRLNKFPKTPNSLRKDPNIDSPRNQINFTLTSLYHHYYLDNYGVTPISSGYKNFELVRFLDTGSHFRIAGNGIGSSTASRRNRSYELGQAFMRLFLHDHLGIIYFAHMDNVLDKKTHPAFGGLTINRINGGDAPDYLCARNSNKVYIGEAKGRYRAINFTTVEFKKWREQFNKIDIRDSGGNSVSVKGFIVATRFATTSHPKVKTTVYAEDPKTVGDIDINKSDYKLGMLEISMHYAYIAQKINQSNLSFALYSGKSLTENAKIDVARWEFVSGPLTGKIFIGGYFSNCIYSWKLSQILENSEILNDLLGLNLSEKNIERKVNFLNNEVHFFGVSEAVFKTISQYARTGNYIQDDLREDLKAFENDNISLLKDGTVLAPLKMLKFLGTTTF